MSHYNFMHALKGSDFIDNDSSQTQIIQMEFSNRIENFFILLSEE